MGISVSKLLKEQSRSQHTNNDIVIAGLGSEWPSTVIGPEELEKYALRFYPDNPDWLKALFKVNKQTGIKTRAVVDIWSEPSWNRDEIPTAEDVDRTYRRYGVELAIGAAKKALADSNTKASAITHIVSVTATNAGSPGFDHAVAQALDLPTTTERVLLSGVGCAGGLTAVRVASDLALAAQSKGRAARILVIACEICSIQIRGELHAASLSGKLGIGPALFSDGAAALVMCNTLSLTEKTPLKFSVTDCRIRTMPGTLGEMAYRTTQHGFLLELSKKVPEAAARAVREPFESLKRAWNLDSYSPSDFDWALHPGGLAIIKGVQTSMQLPDQALAATNEIYQNKGNASSVTVLAVLNLMKDMESRKKNIIAVSFGPGLIVEMALLRRL